MKFEKGDIIICVDDEGLDKRHIAKGVLYTVEITSTGNTVRITDNEGKSATYYADRFRLVERKFNTMSKQKDLVTHVVPGIETTNPNVKVGRRLTVDEKRYYELVRAENVLNRLWVYIRSELGLSEVPWALQTKIDEDTIRLRTLEIIVEKIKTFSEEEMSNA